MTRRTWLRSLIALPALVVAKALPRAAPDPAVLPIKGEWTYVTVWHEQGRSFKEVRYLRGLVRIDDEKGGQS